MAVGSDLIEKFLKHAAGLSGGIHYTALSFTCGASTQTEDPADRTYSSTAGSTTVVIRHPAESGTDYFDVTIIPYGDPCTVELVGNDASIGATYTSTFYAVAYYQSVIFTIGVGVS